MFTVELVAILLALTRISFDVVDSFLIYSDSRSDLQALGSLYPRNFLVLKIQRFLCDLHSYHMGWGESGFNCWEVKGPVLEFFLFYVNVSGMHPRARLSSQLMTILAPWVFLHVRVSIPLVLWFYPG